MILYHDGALIESAKIRTYNYSQGRVTEEVWNPESNSIEVPIDLLAKLKAMALQELGLGETLYFAMN